MSLHIILNNGFERVLHIFLPPPSPFLDACNADSLASPALPNAPEAQPPDPFAAETSLKTSSPTTVDAATPTAAASATTTDLDLFGG